MSLTEEIDSHDLKILNEDTEKPDFEVDYDAIFSKKEILKVIEDAYSKLFVLIII